jgi:hypothetical protein
MNRILYVARRAKGLTEQQMATFLEVDETTTTLGASYGATFGSTAGAVLLEVLLVFLPMAQPPA